MAFEPQVTSFSKANAQILAQASAMAYREPAQCRKWAAVSGFTKDALTFAKGAFNLQVAGQVAGLLTDSLKSLISGNFTEEHERAFRERAIEILKGGVEKIEDHSMDRHYLARLETKLPSM